MLLAMHRTLTLLGAMRLTGWVVLQTMFATTNADRLGACVRTCSPGCAEATPSSRLDALKISV